MILAGDIGGTKTVLALYEADGDELRPVREETFPSREHASLQEIVQAFLRGEKGLNLRAGSFGVAGPCLDGKCRATNLPWEFDEVELAAVVGAPRVKLLNDLEAAAYGMLYLKPDELAPLNPRARARHGGNVAVLAAGTGLGEAILYWDGQRYHPLASEGGHTDFAPTNELEIDFLRYLQAKYPGHVSYERVLSGPGFFNLFSFLRERKYARESPALAEKLAEGGNPNAVITELGLANADPLCVATLEIFAALYGAEAGNLALKCLSVGGVFLGGGIAPKMLPALREGPFLSAFVDKGRFRPLLEAMPVQVALNPRAPLLGAAHYALRMIA
jgi:glucokinase